MVFFYCPLRNAYRFWAVPQTEKADVLSNHLDVFCIMYTFRISSTPYLENTIDIWASEFPIGTRIHGIFQYPTDLPRFDSMLSKPRDAGRFTCHMYKCFCMGGATGFLFAANILLTEAYTSCNGPLLGIQSR